MGRKDLHRTCVTALAGIVLAQPVIAQAADEPLTPLARVGPWVVDYDEDFCRLVGIFGEGDRRVSLQLVQAGPSSSYELLLTGRTIDVERQHFTTRWNPGDSYTHTGSFYGQTDDGTRTIQLTTRLLDRPLQEVERGPDTAPELAEHAAQRAFARTVTSLTFASGARIGQRAVTLETGPLDRVLGALDTCGDNLVQSWGFDPEQLRALQKEPEPIGNVGRWVGPDDYPTSAVARGIGGMLKFRLTVEADGTVSNCHIPRSLTDASFSEVACSALSRRARFHPAIDAAGQPVRALYTGTIRFQVS